MCWQQQQQNCRLRILIKKSQNQNQSEIIDKIIVYILDAILFSLFFLVRNCEIKSQLPFICYSMAEMALHIYIYIFTDLELHGWINNDRIDLVPSLYFISLLPLKLTRCFLGQSNFTQISEVHVAQRRKTEKHVWDFWGQLYVWCFSDICQQCGCVTDSSSKVLNPARSTFSRPYLI